MLRPLGAVAAIRLVAGRELRERTRTRAFRWGTVVMLVLSAGLALLPRVLPDQDDPEWTVAVVGDPAPGLEEAVEAVTAVESAAIVLEPRDGDPEELARQGDIDAVLVDGRELLGERSIPDRLQILLTAATGQAAVTAALADAGFSPEEGAELLSPEPLQVRTLAGDDEAAREGVAFIGAIVLFIAILGYGSWVLYSVLEEKANRVVEIIASTVKPSHLLAGKVIAYGLIGVAQLSAIVLVAGAVAGATGTLPDLPAFVPATVAWALVWFVLGFAFYGVGYAAAGSLTSRQEDAQSASTPMVTLVMLAYFASISVVAPNPGSTLAQVLSLVPPLAPIAMPIRIAAGEAAAWEVALALGLMVAATVAMIAVAGRVYERALLKTGSRIPLRDVLRRQVS